MFILAILCAIGTLASLFMGVLNMSKQDNTDPHRSNKLMRARVFFQFGTVFFLGVAALMSGN